MTSIETITISAAGASASVLQFDDIPVEQRNAILGAALLVAIHAGSCQITAADDDDDAASALDHLIDVCQVASRWAVPAGPEKTAEMLASRTIREARLL